MKPTIVQQEIIQSIHDISRLNIIDWNRADGDPVRAMKIIESWLVGNASYALLKLDLHSYPQRDDFPNWHHTRSHEYIGRLLWNSIRSFGGQITFEDAPDFHGEFETEDYGTVNFYGDIGKVSASAFIFTLPRMTLHDLWISVQDESTQVVIEALIDFRYVWREVFVEHTGLRKKAQELINRRTSNASPGTMG